LNYARIWNRAMLSDLSDKCNSEGAMHFNSCAGRQSFAKHTAAQHRPFAGTPVHRTYSFIPGCSAPA